MSEREHGLYESNAMGDGSRIRAVVVSTIDPLMEGRVLVNIPRLIPDGDPAAAKEITKTTNVNADVLQNTEMVDAVSNNIESSNAMWARPLMIASNDFCVPYQGSTIYVIMEDGDPNKLYYTKESPTLNGQTIGMDNVKASADVFTPSKKPLIKVLHEFKDGTTIYYNENPENREYEVKFPSGTSFSISDNEAASHIELITKNKFRIIADDTNKSIHLTTAGGHDVTLSDGGENGDSVISAKTSGGSTFTMTGDGANINMLNSAGAKIDMAGAVITAEAGGGKLVIGGGTVSIN